MNLDIQRFNQTVEAAKQKAPEMAAKIDKAADALLCNPFIHDMDGGLLIMSSSDKNDNIYFAQANKCQCKAADFNQVCWHRICDRLYRLYLRGN